MPVSSAAMDAAVRAIGGESDLDAVRPALGDNLLAHVIAFAPDAHPLMRMLAALSSRLPALLDRPTIADPALHAAMTRLIGTREGRAALRSWAEMSPAGWGASRAAALIDAVQQGMGHPGVAAALIGACDASAALLSDPDEAAFALRRWGQANAAAPTAWMGALAPAERDRLIATVRRDSFSAASCLPWLPPDIACQMQIADDVLGDALTAFAAASPTARAQHAAVLRRLVDRAQPKHLAALTRLACAMREEDVWRRVQMLVQESPDDARRVVAAAPWDALPTHVHAAILERADTSDVCAAITAARGKHARASISWKSAAAFFAALFPAVWDALDAAAQRRWRRALQGRHGHLAVRALGLHPEILAWTEISPALVRAVQRHARDAATLRAALLPVALRAVDLDRAYALLSAMPTMPSDPGVFFCIADGGDDVGIIASVRDTLRSPADLALAIVLRRSGDVGMAIRPCCDAIQHALRERTWDDLTAMTPILDADDRAALMPDDAALARRLAYPEHRAALHQALARLAALPPAVSVSTHVALKRWKPWNAIDAAAAVADALHAHGDVFLALADAITNADLRQALLPLPEDAAQANALRELARDDPPTAQRLAHALRGRLWRDALARLLHAPPHHAVAVWQALSDDMRQEIVAVVSAETSDADPPAIRDPIAALALAALQSEHDDLRNAGHAALTARSARIRTIWMQTMPEMQQMLGALPAFADLIAAPNLSLAIRRGRRRRRA